MFWLTKSYVLNSRYLISPSSSLHTNDKTLPDKARKKSYTNELDHEEGR